MKKTIVIIGLLLMATLPMMAERVSSETARMVATTFLNNNGAKAAQLTDLSKAAGFSNLYIFNAEEGFVVMSADDCVQPILGYSLTGTFKVADMPENISSWLQGYNDGIQGAIDRKLSASEETMKLWKDLRNGNPNTAKATVIVSPLIQTRWDQDSPYNNLCPSNCVTGCVATAMAQVMKYWNYPAHGIGSHSYIPENNPSLGEQFADFSSTNYDWNHMTNTYSGSSTSIQKQAVATLMYHCGVSVEMEYGPSSGAPTSYVADALKAYFGYPSETIYISRYGYDDNDWISLLKSDLDLSRPIQYHGSGSGGGHSFVCDGYDSDNYFHFNWGWSGSCDAYYTVNNLNPGPGGIGSGSYGVYNNNQGGIFRVHSPACTASEPSGLTYTQDGRNVTLNWSVAGGAVSYYIYRDCIRINSTTANSFTEAAPYGAHVYHVRSVDSNDELSLSSNTVTVVVDYPLPVVDDLSATLTGSNAQLSWTAPEWCYPENASGLLNYGDGEINYSWSCSYYAHKHPASSLTGYSGMFLYKISTFIQFSGDYSAYVYVGTTSDDQPKTLVASTEVNSVSLFNTWIDMDLDNPVMIDNGQDLWIVIKCANTGQLFCAPSFNLSSYQANACYGGDAPDEFGCAPSSYPVSWFINGHLSDGTYTYNLYRDEVKVADNLSATTSLASLNNNASNIFTVKTNYAGGETGASNMKGFVKGAVTLASLALGDDDAMTLTSGSSLTVSGTITNSNPANIVIEDGAQLIHHNSPVQATLKKSIDGFGYDNSVPTGWYTIASPVDGFSVSSLTEGEYDLYAYDEESVSWFNQKNSVHNITAFEEGLGLLYANALEKDIAFAGNMKATSAEVSVPMSCQSSNANLKGFNLAGNPFSCNLSTGDINLGGTTLTTYYVVEGGSQLEVRTLAETPIQPGQGFLVQASAAGQELVIHPTGSKDQTEVKPSYLCIKVGGDNFTDRAYVQFGEGNTLKKMALNDGTSKLSLQYDNADYASIRLDSPIGELPILFKAAKNGTYTLTVSETFHSQLSTLHLIDNLTGADIDLLATPSYSFEAKTNDIESRFRLVFYEDSLNNPAEIDGDFIEGKTQILDMTGRVVATDRNTQLAPGIYLLRTVDGNSITTKKIIINK